MKINKSIVSAILLVFIVFSTAGSAVVAIDPLTLTVTFDKKTAKVGDTVQVTISQKNNGIYDSFKNIKLLITIEGDGKSLDKSSYALNPPGDKGKNNFTATTGLWQSNNLKKDSEAGGVKNLIIYITIPSDLEGKIISASAHYNSIQPDPAIENLTFSTPGDVSDTLTVQKTSTTTENSTNTGNSGQSNQNTTKKSAVTNALKNATSGSGIDALQNLNQPQGNAYEVTNATPISSDNSRTAYMVLGGLIIAFIVGIGYFKGIKG